MLYAEKGNRVTDITESQIDMFVSQGYRIIDDKGKVVKETIPTSISELKLAYVNHTRTIDDLTKQINDLNEKIKALESVSKSKTKKSDFSN